MRRPWTTEQWKAECQYISDTTDDVLRSPARKHKALRNFSNDRACFVRYCEMQRNFATTDGCFDSAQYIQHCIDDLSTVMRRPWTTEQWKAECQYISDTTDDVLRSPARKHKALRNFSNDRACFVRYCEMQRNFATTDGCFDSAQYIQHCIDDLSE